MKCNYMFYRLNSFLYSRLRTRHIGSSSVVNDLHKIIEEDSDLLNSEVHVDKIAIVKAAQSANRPSPNHYKVLTEYFNSKRHLKPIIKQIPDRYLEKSFISHSNIFVVDKDVAGKIFEKIKPYLQSHKGHIIEINAGLGVLTEYLIKANLPRLRIYEADSALYEQLNNKINTYKSDAQLFYANLINLWKMLFQDRSDNGKRLPSLFEGIPTFAWEDDPVVSFIGAVPLENFLKHLMYSIIFQNSIAVYGRPQLFVIISPILYTKLLCSTDQGHFIYRSKAVIFQILFEHTLLLKVPEKAFMPWLRKHKTKIKSPYQPDKNDENNLFLVKLTARRDLFQQIPPNQIKSLWYFVRKLMNKRKAGVIFMMEKWVPGSGVRLIAHGYTIFTQCGSLTPEQYVELFKMFSSWPEYKDSSFSADLNSFMMNITESGDAESVLIESFKRSKGRSKNHKFMLGEDEDNADFDNIERGSIIEEHLDNKKK